MPVRCALRITPRVVRNTVLGVQDSDVSAVVTHLRFPKNNLACKQTCRAKLTASPSPPCRVHSSAIRNAPRRKRSEISRLSPNKYCSVPLFSNTSHSLRCSSVKTRLPTALVSPFAESSVVTIDTARITTPKYDLIVDMVVVDSSTGSKLRKPRQPRVCFGNVTLTVKTGGILC
eukprot:78783-Rhodomonas_salina.3